MVSLDLQSLLHYGIEESSASLLLIHINNLIQQKVSDDVSTKVSQIEQELTSKHSLALLKVKLHSFIDSQLLLAGAKSITAVKALVLEKLEVSSQDGTILEHNLLASSDSSVTSTSSDGSASGDFNSNLDSTKDLVNNIILELKNSADTKFLFDTKSKVSTHSELDYSDKNQQSNSKTFKGFKPLESSSSITQSSLSYEELCMHSIL